MAILKISEQPGVTESDPITYHWHIIKDDGTEFQRSAYHTSREKCEEEGRDRLEYAKEQGWL